MKIVIDIPRKTYEHIRADGGHGYFNIWDEDNRIVTKAVFNGKQLPKNHGRLIDENIFMNNVVQYSHQSTRTIGIALKNTPTIIEAEVTADERAT